MYDIHDLYGAAQDRLHADEDGPHVLPPEWGWAFGEDDPTLDWPEIYAIAELEEDLLMSVWDIMSNDDIDAQIVRNGFIGGEVVA